MPLRRSLRCCCAGAYRRATCRPSLHRSDFLQVGPYVIQIKQRPAEGRVLDKELEDKQEQVRAAREAHTAPSAVG